MINSQNNIPLEPVQDYSHDKKWNNIIRKKAISDIAEHMLDPEENDMEHKTIKSKGGKSYAAQYI